MGATCDALKADIYSRRRRTTQEAQTLKQTDRLWDTFPQTPTQSHTTRDAAWRHPEDEGADGRDFRDVDSPVRRMTGRVAEARGAARNNDRLEIQRPISS